MKFSLFSRIFSIPSVLIFLALGFQIGCSSSEKLDDSTAKGAFAWAETLQKKERYEESIAQYTLVKNKFPYTSYATKAELRIGDVNFERESFIEAQGAYQVFKELHPSHPRSDYVTFRLAMSFFKQLPTTIDRDLSIADQAILYFDEVVSSYPTSTYVGSAQKNKTEVLKMLLDKELYIANFYYIREHYQSALGRYEGALAKFRGLGREPEILYGAARSALRFGDRTKYKQFSSRLLESFPETKEARAIKKEVR